MHTITFVARWCSGKVPDLRSVGRGFESQPPAVEATLGKFLAHICVSQQAV